MKLVFLGTPSIAVPTLEAILAAGHSVRLAVTRPDRPLGRSSRPVAPPVKRLAQEKGIEVLQPRKIRCEAFSEKLRATRADVLVVVAYGRILPAAVLRLTTHGAVNVHFSLLPAYRGAAPVQWALARGETLTGVTTMLMNERMDEGDLLLQREVPIEDDEHAPALAGRLAGYGAQLLIETLAGLQSGRLDRRPQDPARASYAPKLTPADGAGDPALTAGEIANRVRAFDPWPGVWLRGAGKRLRLLETRVAAGLAGGEPTGTLIGLTPHGPLMACGGDSRLVLVRVQPEGGRPIGGRDAINGRQLRLGERLERGPVEA